MVGASAGFITPIGYQTNLMVYGPGGYRWGDYIRFGTPLSIIVGIATVLNVPRLAVLAGAGHVPHSAARPSATA